MSGFRFFLFATFLLLFAGRASATETGDCKAGDVATEEVIAPVAFTVIDLEATEALKKKRGERVPFVFCFYTNSADQAELRFRAATARARTLFVEAYNTSGQKPASAEYFPLPGFATFVRSYQNRARLFPISLKLATTWARGESDEAFQVAAVGRLKELMKEPIRADTLPAGISPGETARLVPMADPNELLTLQMIEERGKAAEVNKILPVTRAKMGLEKAYGFDRAMGTFVASFIEPNCIADMDRIADLRSHGDEPVLIADHYESGEVIVKRGEIIGRKSAAAIRHLALMEKSSRKPPCGIMRQLETALPERVALNTPLWVFLICAGLMCVTIGWFLRRELKRKKTRLPGANDDKWRQRALAAEQREKQSREMARSDLISKVARLLSEKFTRRLLSHRAKLLESQQKTAEELEQLGGRLGSVQAQMQGRLLAYERQIADLEEKLLAKEESDRKEIKTEIETIRRKWETENSQTSTRLN